MSVESLVNAYNHASELLNRLLERHPELEDEIRLRDDGGNYIWRTADWLLKERRFNHPSTDGSIRVTLEKQISFQGPPNWVQSTLENSLTGCTAMGPGKFVIVELITGPRDEPIDPNIQPDHEQRWPQVQDR